MNRFSLDYKESHVTVSCEPALEEEAREELARIYDELESFLGRDPYLITLYEPVDVPDDAPPLLAAMAQAAKAAGTGPMAAVAGAIAEHLGVYLKDKGATDIVVENGGDLYLAPTQTKLVGIYAGESSLSNRFAFKLTPEETPLGICTSSASVGPSVSLGDADAVTCIAPSTPLADAAATAVANAVRGPNAVEAGIEKAGQIPGLQGALIICGDHLGTWGTLPKIVQR